MKRDNRQEEANLPPKSLLLMIEMVNLIPTSLTISNPKLVFKKKFVEATGINYEEADIENSQMMMNAEGWAEREAVEQIRLETKDYPNFLSQLQSLFAKLFDLGIEHASIYGIDCFYNNCLRFFYLRKQLWELSRASSDSTFFRSLGWYCNDWRFSSGVSIKDRRVRVYANFAAKALDGILIDRLRACHICSRIFWAYRKDKFGCSEKCNQNIRTRKIRKKRRSQAKEC